MGWKFIPLIKTEGDRYFQVFIPTSVSRRLRYVRKHYFLDLSDSEFLILVLNHGLDYLSNISLGDE